MKRHRIERPSRLVRVAARCSSAKQRAASSGAVLALALTAQAQDPVSVEQDWILLQTISFEYGRSARLNPIDGSIYAAKRGTGLDDGLYRIEPDGSATKIADGQAPAGVLVDPVDGDMFFSEDFDGEIFRVPYGSTGAELRASGFHGGDDDPIGMAVATSDYCGDVLQPGEALVADRGFSGPDEVWKFSTATPEGESAVHVDDGTLFNAVDVAIGPCEVYVLDTSGIVYLLDAGGALTPLPISPPLASPHGIVIDPQTGDLLISEAGSSSVVRVDPTTGSVGEVITGFVLHSYSNLDLSSDGARLVVTDFGADAIYVFERGHTYMTTISATPAYASTIVAITGGLFDDVVAVELDGVHEPIVAKSDSVILLAPELHAPGLSTVTLIGDGGVLLEAPDALAFLPTLVVDDGVAVGDSLSMELEFGETAGGTLGIVIGLEKLGLPQVLGPAIYHGLWVDLGAYATLLQAHAPPDGSLALDLPVLVNPALVGTRLVVQAIGPAGYGAGYTASFTNPAATEVLPAAE